MKFPLDKYRYYTSDNKVIAISTYGGKKVRGIAKCAPNDTFNLEIGKQLAAARCNEKIAKKRHERARQKYIDAVAAATEAVDYAMQMKEYNSRAFIEYNEAAIELDVMLKSLKAVQDG